MNRNTYWAPEFRRASERLIEADEQLTRVILCGEHRLPDVWAPGRRFLQGVLWGFVFSSPFWIALYFLIAR